MANILNLCIVFLIIFLVSLLWHQLFNISSEESMALTAIFIMIAVFFCGIAGNTIYLYYIVIPLAVLGVIAFGGNISFVKKDQRSICERIALFINPSVVMVAFLFGYAVIAFKGALFTYPDELSQWGPSVRYMVNTGKLPYGESFSGQAITLSTATLFQYIWVGMSEFVERNCFIGNFILAFIPIYLPFSGVKWKEWKKVALYTVLIFLTLNLLSYVKYYTLLQDYVLPMWAGGVIAWILWKKSEKINWWICLGALACIWTMKSLVGPMFSGIIIVVIIIRQLIICEPKRIRAIVNFRTIILTGLTIISMLSMNMIWSVLINQNVYNRFIGYNSEKNLWDIATGIINRSFYLVSGNDSFPNFSFAILFFAVLVVLVAANKQFIDLKQRKQFTLVFSLYGLGFILYLLAMLLAYAVVFGGADSELVAGLERYLSYYMILGCVPLIHLLCSDISWKNEKLMRGIRIGIMTFLVFSVRENFVTKVSAINQKDDDVYKTRQESMEQKEVIEELTGEQGKIFILGMLSSTNSLTLSWELDGRYSWRGDCYKLYIRTHQDVVTYCDVIRYPELLDTLGYDYLWCYDYDEEEDYSILEYRYGVKMLEKGSIYKIIHDTGKISFEYLGNIDEEMEKTE